MTIETERIRRRYARRATPGTQARYSPLDPYVAAACAERHRALVWWILRAGLWPVEEKRVLEIGCGAGANLLELVQLGFRPENLVGNELLEDRAAEARHRLPSATPILVGDAAELDLEEESFDVVLQSTVFSSILDDSFQEKLAARMWSLARPAGGVLWYDFVYNNPANPDVRKVALRRVRELFPGAETFWRRLTLAPPIGRRVARWGRWWYPLLGAIPMLRTHVLCWLKKPRGPMRRCGHPHAQSAARTASTSSDRFAE